jgi:hypothetical protein
MKKLIATLAIVAGLLGGSAVVAPSASASECSVDDENFNDFCRVAAIVSYKLTRILF